MTFVGMGTMWQPGPGIFPALPGGHLALLGGQQHLHFMDEGQRCQEVHRARRGGAKSQPLLGLVSLKLLGPAKLLVSGLA